MSTAKINQAILARTDTPFGAFQAFFSKAMPRTAENHPRLLNPNIKLQEFIDEFGSLLTALGGDIEGNEMLPLLGRLKKGAGLGKQLEKQVIEQVKMIMYENLGVLLTGFMGMLGAICATNPTGQTDEIKIATQNLLT
jgi:hypothetical protein